MEAGHHRLLVVGWEVGDWNVLHRLMDAGRLPTLQRLVDGGVSGPLTFGPPPVPAARWTSLATGKRAWQHQVLLPFQLGGPRPEPVGASVRHARGFWEILSGTGRQTLSVGWPATHGGASPGIAVSDRFHLPTAPPGQPWPGAVAGTYHPAALGDRLDALRVSPAEIDPSVIARFVPEWRRIDQERDASLAKLRILLAADFSYQAAITGLMETEPWELATVRFPALGEVSRQFARDHLFEGHPAAKTNPLFREILPNWYEVLDTMLHRLIELAGPDAGVLLVTAGGIAATADGIARDEGPAGILVACGPGFERDALVHGAREIDVTPTILQWFGLACGGDMEGRPLIAGFSEPREIPLGPSWEDPSEVADETTANLSPPHRRERDWNRSRSLLDAGRPGDALPVLESLFRGFPENPTFSETLFRTQLALGFHDAARDTLEVLQESIPAPAAGLARAELAWARGDSPGARREVLELLKYPAHSSPAWHRIGMLLLALREWEPLERCARAVLESSDRDPIAWLGLAECLLRRRDFTGAAQAAQRAVALQQDLPETHLALARALVGQGMRRLAIESLERLLRISPSHEVARAYLRRLRGVD